MLPSDTAMALACGGEGEVALDPRQLATAASSDARARRREGRRILGYTTLQRAGRKLSSAFMLKMSSLPYRSL